MDLVINKLDEQNEIIISNGTISVGKYAGYKNSAKKVVLPDSLCLIENYAFAECEQLEEIIIPNNVAYIGERGFYNCKNLKKVNLPDSIMYIDSGAFSGCENIEEITLSSNLKKIGYRAFADCKRLKKIIIPEGIEELQWGVFAGCQSLEEVILPNSLKTIGVQLFLNCKNLKRITFPENINYLPDEFFRGCTNLNIELNPNITSLGKGVFENCVRQSKYPSHIINFGDNCFKNCRSLTEVVLNDNITFLPNSAFEGCTNLKNISAQSDKIVYVSKKCFRNCKSLMQIPDFVKNYNESSFENCTGIEEITIKDTYIALACFRGCKNLKIINNQDYIYKLDAFAFSGCESLEEINIVHADEISAETFSNCKSLKKVNLNLGIFQINSRAFFNCYSLSDINLPETLKVIRKEAFKNCRSIKKIIIPSSLITIDDGAFSYMDSLETIEVSPYNKQFITPDNKILIKPMQEELVLYASGCKDKEYSLKKYVIELDEFKNSIVKPITYIGEYAFAGAKNLEELTICSCTQDIEATAFYGCENLKKLNIDAITFYSCPGFHIRDHSQHCFSDVSRSKIYMPFETVTFTGKVHSIFSNALAHFTNVTTLNLPKEGEYNINSFAFNDCTLLKEVNIPEQVKSIAHDAFSSNTKLIFKNGIKSDGFISLSHSNKYIGDYKLYTFNDGTYHIEQDGKITTITKKYIADICSHSELIDDNPILFLDFMNDLIKHDLGLKILFNGILMNYLSLENRKLLLNNLDKNDVFFLNVLKYSGLLDNVDETTITLLQTNEFEKVIQYINLLKKYNIDNPLLFNKFFMKNYSLENFGKLINFDLPLFIKTIEESNLLKSDNIKLLSENNESERESYYLTNQILINNTIENFIKYIKKYDIKDKYLFKKALIIICNNQKAEKLFKIYDANTKRLLKASMIVENALTAEQNLSDLLVLMEIIGALEENPIIRQRASTFITERIFADKMPNGDNNNYRIIGDDIHRIFNFPYTRDEFDKEFADFFMENYQNLMTEEIRMSGFIQRIYLNFREISRTCTSHKGSQRKLKVTLDKCKNFLSNVKFDGVNGENKEFADLIGIWYDNNSVWLDAQKIYQEALSAPRNIFTKITQNEDGTIIFDNNPNLDLKENINSNFSYEWLPKQDYDNLILGKYCNCCAHINGAGQGIMRASMILDNCQNLVIRNNLGIIIAKATLFVNREKGYAVFNNVETSLNYRDSENKEKIYQAFLRGALAFITTYNENNEKFPIYNISIGANRNTILEYLTNEKHPEIEIQQALDYGNYSLSGSGYSGDWKTKQRLVLKRI